MLFFIKDPVLSSNLMLLFNKNCKVVLYTITNKFNIKVL